ncbi:MAG TPA: bifunctional serine/threonine-protein kinase/formylglycine-generating enzyme family protein [Candidatus Cloacimonadota bacterium]|nr:bifunctional serine/threonine-protein kinase/formylglycine-generating enzyme family protein [Candidatus Cloacimonadota bacterium]HPS38421.1 bifunctional serine/threonine-protein kinase/formylglycine-generating enzyme family protein [Candidatus Cloacimonadota bacterium]
MDLQAGSVIRDYKIISLIGEGGMGKVYLAEETILGRKVALKVLNQIFTGDSQFSQRFINEARIQSKLVHSGIVTLYNFFEQEGSHVMVMEYAAGKTLRETLNSTGPIPEARALKLFRQIIATLDYAHEQGIIHRDIKPANIMIDERDQVRLMDFGIARLANDRHLTETGKNIGTLYYMSPEQVAASKSLDFHTDIYSAGIVLFEMLSGKLPFQTDTDSDYFLMKEILESPLPDPRQHYPYISDTAVALLDALTQKDPAVRPDGKAILKLLDGFTTISSPQETVPHQTFTPPRPQPRPVPKPVIQAPPRQAGKSLKTPLLVIGIVAVLILAVLLVPRLLPKKGSTGAAKPDSILVTRSDGSVVSVTEPVLVTVEGGEFSMGDTFGGGRTDELPVVTQNLKSFRISAYEVSQKEWEAVMGNNPSQVKDAELPVTNVTWYDAARYCDKLSHAFNLTPVYNIPDGAVKATAIRMNKDANGFRLPTEAEWEYAARGGNRSGTTIYSGSNDAPQVAVYQANSGGTPARCGSRQANELGLYDMSGNVWEWVWDWGFDAYPEYPVYGGEVSGENKIFRGGAYDYPEKELRVCGRIRTWPHRKEKDLGFRVCRNVN